VGDDPGDRRDGGSLLSRALAAVAFGSVRSRHNRGGVLAGHRVMARHIGRLCLGCGFLLWGCNRPVPSVELVGFAVLPADYFVPGPTSGQFIAAANGRAPPLSDDSTIGLINDNNYPFGLGRHIELGEPDDSEFILVRVRRQPAS
jgi:hypothetical protein